MIQKYTISVLFLFAITFSGLTATTVQAAGLDFLISKRVEADPKKEYPLSVSDGPWLIVVHSFSGENARENANALVLELRKKYKLNAYVYDKLFEFRVEEGMRATERQFRKKDKYIKTAAKEYAVLVGNFQSIEEPAYQKALQTIKRSQPDCLKGAAGMQIQQVGLKPGLGPLGLAFGTTNPLLPPDYFNQKGVVDAFVEKLNSDSPHSLLTCPALYTVRVATFKGNVEIRKYSSEDIVLSKSEEEKFNKSNLATAGATASLLCKALRLKGYEAYEFHDRYSSIVTVGGFNTIGTQGPRGMIEMPPEILQIYERFQGKYVGSKETNQSAYMPKSLNNIEFDVQPMLIQVPKRQRDVLNNLKNENKSAVSQR